MNTPYKLKYKRLILTICMSKLKNKPRGIRRTVCIRIQHSYCNVLTILCKNIPEKEQDDVY